MKKKVKHDPKKHGKVFRGKSLTIQGLDYKVGDLVRKFQSGGAISNALLREGEYHPHGSIPPEASEDYIDLSDAAAVAEATHKAQMKIEEEKVKEAKEKRKAEYDKRVADEVQRILQERDEQNDAK